jgi:hypothetical protein
VLQPGAGGGKRVFRPLRLALLLALTPDPGLMPQLA